MSFRRSNDRIPSPDQVLVKLRYKFQKYQCFIYPTEREIAYIIGQILAGIRFIESSELGPSTISGRTIRISREGKVKIDPTIDSMDGEGSSADASSLGSLMLSMMNETQETLKATGATTGELFEVESNRKLSEPTDRAVALSGLAARIAEALDCQERYGIFGLYLHRTLLWRRSSVPMTRIEYKSRDDSREVPSWSWMAYTGGIGFIEDRFGDLEVFKNLRFAEGDRKALITDLWEFGDCHLKEEEVTSYKILDLGGMEIGQIKTNNAKLNADLGNPMRVFSDGTPRIPVPIQITFQNRAHLEVDCIPKPMKM